MVSKIREKLRGAPDKPGCYIMRDRRGRIIYVGKAVSLRKRVGSYFRQSSLRRGDPKLRSLVNSVRDIEFIVVRNEAEAILTEGKLIKDYRPYFNVKFRDDKRFLMIRTDPSEPFPAFELCRIKRDDGAVYYGPYASSAAARATIAFIEKTFGVRKTPAIAPAAGEQKSDEYRGRYEEARAFLRGNRPRYLKTLEEEMNRAARNMDFERAAALRDTLFRLRAAVKQNARIAPTPEMRKIEAASGIEELRKALGLKRPPRVIEGYDISNISGTYAVGSMVCGVDGLPRRNKYRRFRIKTVERSDDPAMVAEVIRRRFSRLLAEGDEQPDLALIDGGKPQLRAARAELSALGLSVPAAGLAKRLEEIYWKDDEPPIRLPAESPALKVLQRLRDEAHRFALAYHLRLRGKLIRESALDEVAGIGEKKKQTLLSRFGSARGLRKATETEIAQTPGIGYKLARAIKEALK